MPFVLKIRVIDRELNIYLFKNAAGFDLLWLK